MVRALRVRKMEPKEVTPLYHPKQLDIDRTGQIPHLYRYDNGFVSLIWPEDGTMELLIPAQREDWKEVMQPTEPRRIITLQ